MTIGDAASAPSRDRQLAIAVITADPSFLAEAIGATSDACQGALTLYTELPPPSGAHGEDHPLYTEGVARARRYLDAHPLGLTLVQASTVEAAAHTLSLHPEAGPLGVLWIDVDDEAKAGLDETIESFYVALDRVTRSVVRSPYSVLAHLRSAPWKTGAHILPDRFLVRVRVPERSWLLRLEQLSALLDFVERTFDKPRNHKSATRELGNAIGDEVVRFMVDRAGSDWLFFSYTGSSVSPLIDHIERAATAKGARSLRAANEHGLACGALANHLLHDRPFLAVVGTAMMDEFRGTLANLRTAEARGLILCPEADPGNWFTFQGTINTDEDMRESLAARRVPCIYVESADRMADRLEEAFQLYEQGRGPVVLLLTQGVLDARDPLPRPPTYPPRRPVIEVGETQDVGITKALEILNHEHTKVLWQASRSDAEEQAIILDIADRAGVALVDTLGHPGPTHVGGQPIRGHLGTLGLYGFNQRSYAFLHQGGKLAPRSDQCLFFIKSRVGQRATNFTPFRRAGLRMVQVTHRAEHVAPDVELALVMEARDFLRRIQAGLKVDPTVRNHRLAAIQSASAVTTDLASRIPSLPMSPNFFMRELGALFSRMIEHDGFDYTGVYDVGRCSVSATRSVPRTRRGWSGWYGRALMGDAPAALPTLAITEPSSVVAFVGDGGRSIIADPVPHLLENALTYPELVDKNITIFYFSNGTFSGIRTYRERLASRWGGRQMRTVDLLPHDGEQALGPLTLVRRTLTTFDGGALRDALLARRRLNVFTVLLGHNNDDDGFSFVTADWQRELG
ncbi:MAG TPA: biosynthesis protein PigD [Polyangia bacterium]|jgi:thiamine pyrophosphate-dependent acetolactate synthase large subunit-like protein|nr:biosynthesis protein PigD [Polyangia bacterium]